jgi:signal transduction histidine kinase
MKSSHARRSEKASRAARKRHAVVRAVTPTTVRLREAPAPSRVEVDRLMHQLREANEKLIVAAVGAQSASDVARTEAVQARTELDSAMSQLEDANERLTAAAAEAESMAEEAMEREEEYRQLCSRLLTLQDEERRRLALELHDSTAQNLAVLIMNLGMLEQSEPALTDESRRTLAESRSLADECCRDVRMRAYLLHPPLLDEMGLVSAVRWFSDGFTKRSGIQVILILGDIGRLPMPIETALFRVVQESLTNVHRHASTTRVVIQLAMIGDAISLEVRDQGRGLDDDRSQQVSHSASRTLGVGIQGMRERISQLKGTFDVEFTKQGTTVRVGVPLNKATP